MLLSYNRETSQSVNQLTSFYMIKKPVIKARTYKLFKFSMDNV